MIKKVVLLVTVVIGLILSVTYVASGSPISANQPLQMSTVAMGTDSMELADHSSAISGLSGSHRTMAAVDPCAVDFNESGVVDVGDIMLVADCWRSTDTECDRYKLDEDDDIDIVDIMLVAAQWGNPCPTTLPPYGVQLLGGESIPAVLSLAQQAGIEWVRVYLYWSSIESSNTTPDNYNWGSYDSKFASLAAAGLTPMVTVRGNPSWASDNPFGPIDPEDLSEFGQFVGAVVARYSVPPYNVKYWEFYNESDGWITWGGHGAEYGAMLKEAWGAVRGADPYGKVVFAGISYEDVHWSGCPPQGCFDFGFVDDVLDALQGESCFPCVDVWNYHYYRALGPNWSPPTVVGKGLHLRNRLPVELQGMPFVCTELAHPWGGNNPPSNDYSHENAARYVVQGFVRGMAGLREYGLNLWGSTWFTMREYHGGEGNDWGLVSSSLDPYLAYYAYQTMTQELAGAEYDHALSVSGVEGYVFSLPGGGEKTVLWATGSNTDVAFTGSELRVVQKDGSEETIQDGGSGDLDSTPGQITIQVTQSPIFVQAF